VGSALAPQHLPLHRIVNP